MFTREDLHFLPFFFLAPADSIGIDVRQRPKIERVQELAMHELNNYCRQKASGRNQQHYSDRFAKLLIKLVALRALDADTVEDLFFTNLIGQVQIENVIPYILQLGGAGVSGDFVLFDWFLFFD